MIAMIWAAAAMGLYNSGSTAGATAAVGEVAKRTSRTGWRNYCNPGGITYRSFLPSDDCRLYSDQRKEQIQHLYVLFRLLPS